MSEGVSSRVHEKYSDMLTLLRKTGHAILAFSGGVDSLFLLYAMKMADMKVLAVTASSETMTTRDLLDAQSFAREAGIEHVTIRTDELANEAFVSNTPDRCFYCKEELFKKIRSIAEDEKIAVIFDGTNSDDLHDFRPGRKAAELYGVKSPLAECNLSKAEIRLLSKELGLPAWNRPASPCLASRFPYGERITLQALGRIEKAEEFLRTFGIRDVRVRTHGDTARIEVNEDSLHIIISPENRLRIADTLKSYGYKFVCLDLEGYRAGSLNRVLDHRHSKLKRQFAR